MENSTKNSGKYDDIIQLEHPTSPTHPRMSPIERAAQFSAFAVLNGYEEAVEEATESESARLAE